MKEYYKFLYGVEIAFFIMGAIFFTGAFVEKVFNYLNLLIGFGLLIPSTIGIYFYSRLE